MRHVEFGDGRTNSQLNTTPDDDQKYGHKRLGRRYGTIPLPSGSQHKKNNKDS